MTIYRLECKIDPTYSPKTNEPSKEEVLLKAESKLKLITSGQLGVIFESNKDKNISRNSIVDISFFYNPDAHAEIVEAISLSKDFISTHMVIFEIHKKG